MLGGRLTAFKTQYQEDIQTFEHSLETLDQEEVSENLHVFRTNNTSLEKAIASLKSAQVQLQQQCTTAHAALFKTLGNREQEAIDVLIEDPRLDANERDHSINSSDSSGFTLLHMAARRGYVAVVQRLINKKADINAPLHRYTNLGVLRAYITPLQLAVRTGHAAVVRVLVDEGARIHETDFDGNTALHDAAIFGHSIDIVDILLEKGADVNMQNDYNRTALNEAESRGYPAIVERLRAAGARR